MGYNTLGDNFARGCGGGSESIHSGIVLPPGNLQQYKSCVRERQLESVEAFSLCCYMHTCFDSSVLSPVVGSAVAKSVWLALGLGFKSHSFSLQTLHQSSAYIVILQMNCVVLIVSQARLFILPNSEKSSGNETSSDPQALIWFWESTGTLLSYCLNEIIQQRADDESFKFTAPRTS